MNRNISFLFIFYGLYCLGFFIFSAVEVFKLGYVNTGSPIPIRISFVVGLAVAVFVLELFFTFLDRLREDTI